ncbi:ComEA family DNA-binding protein [Mollicutes bacterium LVI A0039]|nr:ComEA family DNA-binding protein [Mollicutes bacterium LVI A0039]
MNLSNNKIVVAGAIGLCVMFIPLSQLFSNEQIEIISEVQSQEPSLEIVSEIIYVQVSGAVGKPGLYQMNRGDRINDLMTVADAKSYNEKCINLAQKLVDEQNIYIPNSTEPCPEQPAINASGIVNINLANQYELQTLPGIGEAKAQKIIEYRNDHGTFQSKEQLLEVDGISETLLSSISELIILA